MARTLLSLPSLVLLVLSCSSFFVAARRRKSLRMVASRCEWLQVAQLFIIFALGVFDDFGGMHGVLADSDEWR